MIPLDHLDWGHLKLYNRVCGEKDIQENYLVDTLTTAYNQKAFTDLSKSSTVCIEKFSMIVIMRKYSIPKTEYNLKAIMYPASGKQKTVQFRRILIWYVF